MTIGEIINQYREEHQLSMRALAIQCDVSNGYIAMLERGKNPKTGDPITPSLKTMMKLANGMHMNLDDFIGLLDENTVINLNDDAPSLTYEEGQLLEYFRSLDERGQKMLLNIAKGMLE